MLYCIWLLVGVDVVVVMFVEVWGDMVVMKYFVWLVLFGIVISFGVFEIGCIVFVLFVYDVVIVCVYVMLIGFGGCLLVGMICVVLFKLKCMVIEYVVGSVECDDVLW